ncbi:MAG: phage major capsid protein, partial [Bacteroidaceae bacterium]|nr:phage major capsid protein [Bacteroidaceae bacterium]
MSVTVNNYDATLVADLVNKVKGKSSLAALGQQTPVEFTGNKEFTFTMDNDVDIVAENGAKSHGGVTIDPVTIIPVKFEYGARISDEFMTASDEKKVDILTAFNDGFARKLAAGLDMAAMHGINPRSKVVSSLVSAKSFDVMVQNTVTYLNNNTKADANIEAAIALVEGGDGEVTGIAISPTVRSALAAMTTQAGEKLYPDFAFGGQPASLGTQALSINKTVQTAVKAPAAATAAIVDHAIVGDFANMFKWGFGKDITVEVIEYGDPDNSGSDLKGHNQVYLRGEAY